MNMINIQAITYTFSGTGNWTDSDNWSPKLDVSVYPNPTTDELYVDLSQSLNTLSQNTAGRIQLFNSHVKSLLEMDVPSDNPHLIIHLKNYPKGIYALLIAVGQDFVTKNIRCSTI